MELRQPKRKKYCKLNKNKTLPIVSKNQNEIIKYRGRFNGISVIIDSIEDAKTISCMGYFGKGNLSRSFPCYDRKAQPILIRDRQYNRRQNWSDKYHLINAKETVICVKDSDSENDEEFLNDIKFDRKETFALKETLNLSLEESFFLSSAVNCLDIYYYNNNVLLDKEATWKLFCQSQENFIQNYIAYYYFRVRHWIIKSGLKFGGDFLLYKEGPPLYHASYVIIVVPSKTNPTENNSLDWNDLIGLNRLTETAAKEVLICEVIWPEKLTLNEAKSSSAVLKLFSVNTILLRRWIAKQKKL